MGKDSKKRLMFQVSATLSQVEAIDFVRTLSPNEKWWLVKTAREKTMDKYVIVRNLRPGEVPVGSCRRYVERDELISLGKWQKKSC